GLSQVDSRFREIGLLAKRLLVFRNGVGCSPLVGQRQAQAIARFEGTGAPAQRFSKTNDRLGGLALRIQDIPQAIVSLLVVGQQFNDLAPLLGRLAPLTKVLQKLCEIFMENPVIRRPPYRLVVERRGGFERLGAPGLVERGQLLPESLVAGIVIELTRER